MPAVLEIDFESLMEARGKTIQDLADETGLNYRVVYHHIRGKPEYVSLKVVAAVLLVLGAKVQPPFYVHTGENLDHDSITGDRSDTGSPG